jgi:hypothetical protein
MLSKIVRAKEITANYISVIGGLNNRIIGTAANTLETPTRNRTKKKANF